jgi:hypothetical protein
MRDTKQAVAIARKEHERNEQVFAAARQRMGGGR